MAWQNVNSLFVKLVHEFAGEKYRDFVRIYMAWKPTVGELLAEKSQPCKYENGVLFVKVKNNVWMQELILLKTSIITKYKIERNIKIDQIVFLIG